MKEEFLHYLWKYGLYDNTRLSDREGNRIIVLHPGDYNRDSGPDFFNARISINDTIWAGNVEIHIKSSYFNLHGHSTDPAYNNVILHIVAEDDKAVFNSAGEELLTIEIKYNPTLYDCYTNLVNNPYIIACEAEVSGIDSILIRQWLSALALERIQAKSELIQKIYSETGNDWEETFYRLLVRYFGFRVNSEPFEMTATALAFKIIRKHADNRFQVEALLYGTAGMLEEKLFKEAIGDKYFLDLIKEYKILSTKYSLKPIHGWLWKFSRLRPVNFPTIRISQLASMLTVSGGLFSRVLEAYEIRHLRALFEVSASDYWDKHYVFGRRVAGKQKRTGSQAVDILLINSVIPIIFAYGATHDRGDITEKALNFLDAIEPEHNSVINEWKRVGIDASSALYSQALIQLRNEYCRKRRCLECRIGSVLIKRGGRLLAQNELLLEPELD